MNSTNLYVSSSQRKLCCVRCATYEILHRPTNHILRRVKRRSQMRSHGSPCWNCAELCLLFTTIPLYSLLHNFFASRLLTKIKARLICPQNRSELVSLWNPDQFMEIMRDRIVKLITPDYTLQVAVEKKVEKKSILFVLSSWKMQPQLPLPDWLHSIQLRVTRKTE